MTRHNQTPKSSEEQRKYMRDYYVRNQAKMNARHKAYYQTNKVELLRKEKESRDPKQKWAYMLQYKFGITVEQYEAMLVQQNGICAICKKPPSGRFKRLAVDHCHKTGIIRGLLHRSCNRAIGLLLDSSELMDSASAYLRGIR